MSNKIKIQMLEGVKVLALKELKRVLQSKGINLDTDEKALLALKRLLDIHAKCEIMQSEVFNWD